MRIAIRHETHYTYATPPKSIIQLLRLTPRSHEGQHVISWRIDCDADCRLKAGEDAFGNITHTFTVAGPIASLNLSVEGDIETFDTSGLVRNTVERFPPYFILRDTPLTHASEDIRMLAHESTAGDRLSRLHDLMRNLHTAMTFDVFHPSGDHCKRSVLARTRRLPGLCAYLYRRRARAAGIPARYVSGHFYRDDGVIDQEAGHAWAEAFVPNLGWVGFDPANCICPHESHVRVACGLDYLDAAPVRGARMAGAGETLRVNVAVAQARSQRQT